MKEREIYWILALLMTLIMILQPILVIGVIYLILLSIVLIAALDVQSFVGRSLIYAGVLLLPCLNLQLGIALLGQMVLIIALVLLGDWYTAAERKEGKNRNSSPVDNPYRRSMYIKVHYYPLGQLLHKFANRFFGEKVNDPILGLYLYRFSNRLFDEKTNERIFEPLIAELQAKFQEAIRCGNEKEAWLIRLRLFYEFAYETVRHTLIRKI